MVDVAEKEVAAQSHFPIAGDVFVGRFTIESVLNRGGFGCVYKAMQNDLGRPVAIKVLRPATRVGFNDDVSAEERRLEIVSKRFEREAQLVSQLRDPHTVLMYEYGQTPEGLLYMVLEFISGDALSRVVELEGALSPDRAVNIVLQVLSSLEEAHARGVLHRDIKPPNIMLYSHMGRPDQVKVLDFGLAKSMDDPVFNADNPDLTDDEVLIGTPRYMSPEQIRGHRLAPSTDIYSLGLVFYELLAGEKAVMAKSTMNTLARHINEVPIRLPEELEVDSSLRGIVNRMIEKDVSIRYASASAIMADLEEWKAAPYLAFELDEAIDDFEPSIAVPNDRKRIAVVVLIAFLLFSLSYVLFGRMFETDPPIAEVVQEPVASKTEPAIEVQPEIEPEPPVVVIEAPVVTEEPPDAIKIEPSDIVVEKETIRPVRPKSTSKKIRKPNLTTLP